MSLPIEPQQSRRFTEAVSIVASGGDHENVMKGVDGADYGDLDGDHFTKAQQTDVTASTIEEVNAFYAETRPVKGLVIL